MHSPTPQLATAQLPGKAGAPGNYTSQVPQLATGHAYVAFEAFDWHVEIWDSVATWPPAGGSA